jgi:hypothetical protein
MSIAWGMIAASVLRPWIRLGQVGTRRPFLYGKFQRLQILVIEQPPEGTGSHLP